MDEETRYSLLSAISNDYENVGTIDESLRFQGLKSLVTHAEIDAALKELIDAGLAQACQVSPHPPHTQKVDFHEKLVERLWFYVTPKGKELVKILDGMATIDQSPKGESD